MKKLWILLTLFPLSLLSQVLAPAADGHILRNETYRFDQGTGQPTGETGLTYFVYFQDLYVGGENTFTGDFDPNDGIATHYNRELRGIVEFDLSSLNLSPGTFSAFLELTNDSNFWPVSPFTLDVYAYDMNDTQEDGLVTQNDYNSLSAQLSMQTVDGQNFGIRYSWNVTQAVNDDLQDPEPYSGFVLKADPLNGNEIGFISSYEASQGQGEGPALRFEASQADIQVTVPTCGETIAGNVQTLTVTVKNVGQADLTINQVVETSDPANTFELDTTGMASTLSPGSTTTFTITFSALQTGLYSATYTIFSNDPDTPEYSFQVSCTVVEAPQPHLSITVGTCQDTPTGQSTTIPVTLTNTGSADLTISNVVEVDDPSGFFEVDTSGMDTVIAPGDSTTLSILYSPTSYGSHSATYAVESNDPDAPTQEFVVSCQALQQGGDIFVEPSVVYFSAIPVGQPATETVLIKNVGNGDLKIEGLNYQGDPVFSLDTSEFKTTLHPGEQTSFQVNFQSSETWSYQGVVTIQSNDIDESSVDVPIYGLTIQGGLQTLPVPEAGSYDRVISASAVAEGAYNSFFLTDVAIHNPNGDTLTLTAFFLPAGSSNLNALSATLLLPPHATLVVENVLVLLFDKDRESGAYGSLLFQGNAPFQILSRTYNQTEDQGTFGLSITGVDRNQPMLTGQAGFIPGVAYSSDRRTNVGFVNMGSTQAEVSIEIYSSSGQKLASDSRSIPAYSLLQISLFNLGVQDLTDGYAKITFTKGSGFAYATILDNPTSDSIYVPLP